MLSYITEEESLCNNFLLKLGVAGRDQEILFVIARVNIDITDIYLYKAIKLHFTCKSVHIQFISSVTPIECLWQMF